MKKLLHPYKLALLTAIVSLGVFAYIGLVAPTPESEQIEVKGVTAEPTTYTKTPLMDYGTDLTIIDQSALFDGQFVDQEEIRFSAFSNSSVTYQLYNLRNNTDSKLTLKVIPKTVTDLDLRDMVIKMQFNGGEFELYNHSEKPNQDYFAITLDPYESDDFKLIVQTDELEKESVAGSIIIQFRE